MRLKACQKWAGRTRTCPRTWILSTRTSPGRWAARTCGTTQKTSKSNWTSRSNTARIFIWIRLLHWPRVIMKESVLWPPMVSFAGRPPPSTKRRPLSASPNLCTSDTMTHVSLELIYSDRFFSEAAKCPLFALRFIKHVLWTWDCGRDQLKNKHTCSEAVFFIVLWINRSSLNGGVHRGLQFNILLFDENSEWWCMTWRYCNYTVNGPRG
jgi:hypothetical protein